MNLLIETVLTLTVSAVIVFLWVTFGGTVAVVVGRMFKVGRGE
jgi:hypothetical protein